MSGTGIPQPPETAAPGSAPPGSAAPQPPVEPAAEPASESAAEPASEPALRTLVPLDPPMLPFALGGVAAWFVALLIMLPFRDSHESWFWICVAGLLWGIPGTLTMIRYDARRRRRTSGNANSGG